MKKKNGAGGAGEAHAGGEENDGVPQPQMETGETRFIWATGIDMRGVEELVFRFLSEFRLADDEAP